MQHGDFTALAKAYKYRPGYSIPLLRMILNDLTCQVSKKNKELAVADVGAGTGKLTENLLELGLSLTSIEPNDAMREEGMSYVADRGNVKWQKGSGESTALISSSVDWLLMGSSFHWVDFNKGLAEFNRVLKSGGYFTAIWNPRNILSSELHSGIESKIQKIVPSLKRVSSGSSGFTENLSQKLIASGYFKNVIFLEEEYNITMSKERYMGAWHSTNDIQVQAGAEKWKEILNMIESEIKNLPDISVPYKSRAWTAIKK
ncbi:MAG: class I SAM-dependent methyltransferase [Bacteroidetes bacterium]|nr:class I SAM-dependent methyltransferase [Bacteroidota bacterium]